MPPPLHHINISLPLQNPKPELSLGKNSDASIASLTTKSSFVFSSWNKTGKTLGVQICHTLQLQEEERLVPLIRMCEGEGAHMVAAGLPEHLKL